MARYLQNSSILMKMQIAKLLLKEKVLSEEQLKETLEKVKNTDTEISQALFELGHISENELLDFLGKSFGVPVISIEEHYIEEDVLKLIPREIALENRLIPLSITGSALTVAMSDPSNIIITDELSFLTEKNIIPVVVSERSIVNMLEQYYGYSGKSSKDSEKQAQALEEMLIEHTNHSKGDAKEVEETVPKSPEAEETAVSEKAASALEENTELQVPHMEQSISITGDEEKAIKHITTHEDPSMFDEQMIEDQGSLENIRDDEIETIDNQSEDKQRTYTLTSPDISSTLDFANNPDEVLVRENEIETQDFQTSEITVQSDSSDNALVNNDDSDLRVLIIDHSLIVQKLVALSLKRKGYSVSAVSDGMEALSRLHDLKPNLIYIEINLPHMDGYKVCKIIKSHGLMKRVPVVMMSGKEGLFDKMRSKMAGANGHISKPFALNDIAESASSFTGVFEEGAASA